MTLDRLRKRDVTCLPRPHPCAHKTTSLRRSCRSATCLHLGPSASFAVVCARLRSTPATGNNLRGRHLEPSGTCRSCACGFSIVILAASCAAELHRIGVFVYTGVVCDGAQSLSSPLQDPKEGFSSHTLSVSKPLMPQHSHEHQRCMREKPTVGPGVRLAQAKTTLPASKGPAST